MWDILSNIELSRPIPSFEAQCFLGTWGLTFYAVVDFPDEWGVPAIQ